MPILWHLQSRTGCTAGSQRVAGRLHWETHLVESIKSLFECGQTNPSVDRANSWLTRQRNPVETDFPVDWKQTSGSRKTKKRTHNRPIVRSIEEFMFYLPVSERAFSRASKLLVDVAKKCSWNGFSSRLDKILARAKRRNARTTVNCPVNWKIYVLFAHIRASI